MALNSASSKTGKFPFHCDAKADRCIDTALKAIDTDSKSSDARQDAINASQEPSRRVQEPMCDQTLGIDNELHYKPISVISVDDGSAIDKTKYLLAENGNSPPQSPIAEQSNEIVYMSYEICYKYLPLQLPSHSIPSNTLLRVISSFDTSHKSRIVSVDDIPEVDPDNCISLAQDSWVYEVSTFKGWSFGRVLSPKPNKISVGWFPRNLCAEILPDTIANISCAIKAFQCRPNALSIARILDSFRRLLKNCNCFTSKSFILQDDILKTLRANIYKELGLMVRANRNDDPKIAKLQSGLIVKSAIMFVSYALTSDLVDNQQKQNLLQEPLPQTHSNIPNVEGFLLDFDKDLDVWEKLGGISKALSKAQENLRSHLSKFVGYINSNIDTIIEFQPEIFAAASYASILLEVAKFIIQFAKTMKISPTDILLKGLINSTKKFEDSIELLIEAASDLAFSAEENIQKRSYKRLFQTITACAKYGTSCSTRANQLIEAFEQELCATRLMPSKQVRHSFDITTLQIEDASFVDQECAVADILKDITNCIQESSRDSNGNLTASTIYSLICEMTNPYQPCNDLFVRTFFWTCPMFSNSENVIKTLIARFYDPVWQKLPLEQNDIGKNRVIDLIIFWMSRVWTRSDIIVLSYAGEFAAQLPAKFSSQVEILEKTCALIKEADDQEMALRYKIFIGETYRSQITPNDLPEPQINSKQIKALLVKPKNISITLFKPIEIARQLTLIWHNRYCELTPSEFLSRWYQKKARYDERANLKTLSMMSTKLSAWIIKTVLDEDIVKKRATTIKHWIEIAHFCNLQSSFDVLFAIMSALNSSSLSRLRKTWHLIPSKFSALKNDLDDITSSQRNFVRYRQALRNITPPCSPFVGLVLTDLSFLLQGNSDHKICRKQAQEIPNFQEIKLVNWEKWKRVGAVIDGVCKYQIPYAFQRVRQLCNWLESQINVNEPDTSELWRRSHTLEPSYLET